MSEVVKWILDKLSWILLAIGIGYKIGTSGNDKLNKKLIDAELGEKEAQNAKKVMEDNAGKSDVDIVNDAINSKR